MESRTLKLLEFPKVLKALAGYAVSEPGVSSCLAVQPLDNLQEIHLSGKLTEQAGCWAAEARFTLREFPPLDGLLAFVDEKSEALDIDGFFALAQVLLQAKEARDSLLKGQGCADGLDELRENLCNAPWPQKLATALSRCINPDGNIRDDASPELLVVRTDIRTIHRQCTKKAKDFILSNDLSRFLQDDYITLASDRYVLPLKANFKSRMAGIVHDYSQTGETCYFEPMLLVEQNNKLQELKKEEAREEKKILEYLSTLLRQERDHVGAAYDFLVQLDLLLAKALFGSAIGGRALQVDEGESITLNQVRHPLLALSGENVQAVDIELRPGDRALLISGGNAGGKTVALKTVGLTAIMAYSGLPVPVGSGSVLPFLPRIFVIMGDEQSLEDQVSTFTAQVKNLTRVWADVDDKTLFLLDEFGAGTDPAQGAALAQAVLDRLVERRTFVFAATHFPSLKAWGLSRESVRAASVLFDPQTKRPLYCLAYEIVGESIALDVARDNGLPDEILEKAEKFLLMDGTDTASVLTRLNELAVDRVREITKLETERERLNIKRGKLEERFKTSQEKLLNEVREHSQTIMREWKEGRTGRKLAMKKLSGLREKLTIEDVASSKTAKPFTFSDISIGMKVTYCLWNKQGMVLEIDERKEQLKLDLDGVTMWVKGKDIGPGEGAAAKFAKVAKAAADKALSGSMAPARSELALSLDLRGQRADEAVSELERFLDNAILRGAGRLEIIHGRGTGALRREVHEILKHFPGVELFSLADEDRGGDGMTDVILK